MEEKTKQNIKNQRRQHIRKILDWHDIRLSAIEKHLGIKPPVSED